MHLQTAVVLCRLAISTGQDWAGVAQLVDVNQLETSKILYFALVQFCGTRFTILSKWRKRFNI